MNPVSIHIDKLYKNDLPLEDCKISVPFAKGILYAKDLSALRLLQRPAFPGNPDAALKTEHTHKRKRCMRRNPKGSPPYTALSFFICFENAGSGVLRPRIPGIREQPGLRPVRIEF